MLLRLAVVAAVVVAALAAHRDDDAKPDCHKAGDGYYVNGCSPKFWRCVNDRLYYYDCPKGLYFNPQKRKCEYKVDVPICAEGAAVHAKDVIKASAEFNCTGLADGPYKPRDIACSNTFITCFNGMAIEQACPFNQFFHEESKVCDYKDNVVGCIKSEPTRRHGSKISGSMDYGSAPAPPPARDAPLTLNAKAAQLNACPGLLTGQESEGIPCNADEICQGIQRPKNGRYSCEAPFSVWYGPVRGSSDQWKQAKNFLVCGTDGFWYDSGVKVDAAAIDCTAPKKEFKKNDEQILDCPSLSTNEREIPCKGDDEVCQPINKAVDGKYACPTPYRVWYGPRGGAEDQWKQAKDSLICKSGSWFDGDVKIDATAVDCTVAKIDCRKLGDGAYNGEPGHCSTHFWQCSNERAYLYPCPPGLFFDDYSKTCDFKEAVESCGGARRAPTTTTSAPAKDEPAPAPAKTSDCPTLHTDSSLPCRSGFACVAAADPVNQKYLCETPYNLCYGPKNNVDQWKQADNGLTCKDGQWFNGDEVVTAEAVHCSTSKFACAGKKDGSYSAHPDKCTSYFWNCAHDDSFLYRCPAGLFFDVDTMSCDYKEVNVACGGRKKDATTPQTPSADVVVPLFNCADKEDGYHEDAKCQKKFWNCADKKAFEIACPEGLVYDGRVQRCQYPTACEADLPVTTTPALPPSALDHGDMSQKPVVPTTSFDCSTQQDGLYAEKKCHKQYVQCTNGRTFAKECPAGLVYTPFAQSCDYKAVCMNPPTTTTTAAPTTVPAAPAAAPAATTPSTYATYERVPVTTKAPVVAPAVFDRPNCANLEDGAHAMSRCGQEFFLCWQGEASFSKCGDGLIFSPMSSQCDYRSNVIECGETVSDVPATTPAGAAPPAPPVSTTPTPDLFCEGRQDGHYGSGCASHFYSCHNGGTFKMFCPVGLFFDADTKQCELRETVVVCGGKKEEQSTVAPVAASTATYLPVQPVAPVKDIPRSDKFCSGKVDGFYGNGCLTFFYSCQNGVSYKMACPDGLHYDVDRKMCDRKEDIVACGAAPTTTAPTRVADVPAVPVDTFCAGKTDGYYTIGCASFFYSCMAGVNYKFECPSGLYYDIVKKSCENKEEIVACGAIPQATQAPVSPTKAADIPIAVLENFCAGKVDGFYTTGCRNFFYSCQNGVTYKMDCPSGLYYDGVNKSCDRKEDIVACGGAAQATQEPVSPIKPADVPVVKIENYCNGKTDGFYTVGCAPFFYSCQSGATYKMECPTGLFYDPVRKTCEDKEDIVACGAVPQATQAPVSPIKAADAPVVDVENFCTGKVDGFYTNGCQTFFYSCQNGATYKMDCPSGLYYDGVNKACDHKEEIVACGGVAPITQAPIPTKASDISVATTYNFCAKVRDGFYVGGCSTFFYSCTNGETHKMECPAGLYFDYNNSKCAPKEETVSCGAAPRTTQAPVFPRIDDFPTFPDDHFCNGKIDGVYGNGCQSYFYECQHGATRKSPCYPGLYFDAINRSCALKEKIALCRTAPEATQTPVSPVVAADVPLTHNMCEGKVDGFYGAGCQNFFYSCQSGSTYKMTCASDLFYDIDTKQCDYRDSIVACGGKKADVIAPTAIPALDRPAATENFCLGKVDGFYGVGCSTFFYSCQESATFKMACPSGLYYDIANKACDRKEDIIACGGTPAAIPSIPLAPSPLPAVTAAPVAPSRDLPVIPLITLENFCGGKVDGFYGGNGCLDHFFSCQNGNTYKMMCPSGLFYDATSKACDRREDIVECGGIRPQTPVAPVASYSRVQPTQPVQPVQPATAAPIRDAPVAPVSEANFCVGKMDGDYSFGCNSYYFSCRNGNTLKMACVAGLFYDATSKFCDYKERIVACGGIRVPAPAPSVPLAHDQPAPPVDKFCSGKADGIYGHGCSDFYYTCQSGHTIKMVCPKGLFYDVSSKMCNHRDQIVGCGAVAPIIPAAAPAAPVAPASSQYAPAPVAPARDIVPVAPATSNPALPSSQFCAGKIEGLYSIGCSAFYHSCQNGYSHKMACPSGLFFDASIKQCSRKENIVECGGKLTQPTVAPATSIPVRDIPVLPVENFCAGKPEGAYSFGCAEFYYSCQNGYSYKMACPAGLFYDALTKRCDNKENIVECGAKLTQPTVAPATSVPARDIPVVPVENFCVGKNEGDYAFGCAAFYYSCQNGYSYKMACPSGLFYDAVTKRCDNKENIVECGAKLTQPTAAPITSIPVRDLPVIEKFCSGKTDGLYSIGCSESYHACQNGYSTKMACPSGLFYDAPNKRCDVRENIIECGGKQTQPVVAPITSIPVRDVPVVEKFCSGKANGLYSIGCSSYYHSCHNGNTYKMACPSGLFYDAANKQCDVKENIVECGGKQTQATVAPVVSIPARDIPVLPVENFCSGKADGSYGNGCQAYFYSCQNGATLKMDCSTGLFFDPSTKQCEYRENVVACGGVLPVAPVIPAAAAPATPYNKPAAPPATPYGKPAVVATAAPALDKPAPTPMNDRSCAGQKDGFFGEGCNDFFYSCLNGAAYKMACPTGLFYDLELQSCEYKNNIPNCGGLRPEVTVTPAPINLPRAPVDNSACNGKSDGIYPAADCAGEFITCQAGLVRTEACQTGLFFNQANGMCDYRENVQKCSARDSLPTRAPRPTASPVADYGRTTSRPIKHDHHKQEHHKKKPAHAPSGSSCGAMTDGYYSNGCSTDYMACINGQSMAMHCPPGLMYSASTLMCDYSDNVPECGGSAPVVAKDSSVISPRPAVATTVSPVVPVPNTPAPTQAPVKEVHPRCAGRSDGIYALAPCSQNYIACVDEKATIGICREDLYYSASSGLCDWKEKNTACSVLVRPTPTTTRSVPTTTTPMPATAAPAADVSRPTAERLNRPTIPLGLNIDCGRITDGVYAIYSCMPYYSRCQGGRLAARGTCPAGLIFSPLGGSCVERSAVSACTRPTAAPVIATTQAPAMAPPAQPNYGVQQTQAAAPVYQGQQQYPQQQQQVYGQQQTYTQQYAPSYSASYSTQASGIYADPTQFCYGRSDAIYGSTCQKSYVICQGGATFAFQCPGEFIFNRERAVCDHPTRMPQCGSFGYVPPSYSQQSYSAPSSPY